MIGCDTTSAFHGKGKVKALKIATTNDDYAILFGNLGKAVTVSTQLKNGLYGFVCHLYGHEGWSDVNSVRYEMFKGGKYDEELLPPNQDSLDNHIRRANYQCYIWLHLSMQERLRKQSMLVCEGSNEVLRSLQMHWLQKQFYEHYGQFRE